MQDFTMSDYIRDVPLWEEFINKLENTTAI